MNRKTVYLLVLLFVAGNFFTYLGTSNYYRQQQVRQPAEQPVTEKPDVSEELKPFAEVLDILSERFLEKISREELITAGIKGMVDSLEDPQTSFLDPRDWEEMMIKIDGSFSGIGIEISSVDDYITVVAPIKNTPGEKAGLLPGDRIIQVEGQDMKGFSTMEAVKLIRGPEGSKVTLLVEREGITEPLTFEITRKTIVVPSVFPEMTDNKIGYIQITTFDEHTGRDFQEALLTLEAQGLRGLMIDLRDNPGGLLSEAIKIGQEILPAGPITHVVDGDGIIKETYKSYGTKRNYPIVVLVNGGSASASEIIAGAIQDTGTGVLVGTKTYGKATVQHMENISNSAGLRYTVAKYQTPKGRDIHGQGLTPDVEIDLPEKYFMLKHGIMGDLAPGAEGVHVMFLQKILAAVGETAEETSKYDSTTEKAVRSFQSKYDLPVNGRVDTATRKKLAEIVADELKAMDDQKKKARELLLEKMN